MGDERDFRVKVERDGRWFSEYGEVTHPGVKRYFQRILDCDESGYFLDDGKVRVGVDVASYVFWVEALREREWRGKPWIWLVINDGTEEPLDPATVRILGDNSVECRIKGGKFPAKFTLSSYWQFVENVVERDGRFFLKIGEELYPLEGGDG